MNWITFSEKKPEIGQYIAIKKGDHFVFAFGTGDGEYAFLTDDASNESLWRPIDIKCVDGETFPDGTINFIPVDIDLKDEA